MWRYSVSMRSLNLKLIAHFLERFNSYFQSSLSAIYLLLAILWLPHASLADSYSEQVDFDTYTEQPLPQGTIVCQMLDLTGQNQKCFIVNDFSETLSEHNSSNSSIQPDSKIPEMGHVLNIELKELITEKHPSKFAKAQFFKFHIKFSWNGQAADGFETPIESEFYISGQVVRNPGTKNLEIAHLEIPEFHLGSQFLPDFSIAQLFGGSKPETKEQMEEDIYFWVESIIMKSLYNHFNLKNSIKMVRP